MKRKDYLYSHFNIYASFCFHSDRHEYFIIRKTTRFLKLQIHRFWIDILFSWHFWNLSKLVYLFWWKKSRRYIVEILPIRQKSIQAIDQSIFKKKIDQFMFSVIIFLQGFAYFWLRRDQNWIMSIVKTLHTAVLQVITRDQLYTNVRFLLITNSKFYMI